MKKVIVYIDGFNLYYGMLKGTPYKWLDLEKFVDALVADDVEVIAIKSSGLSLFSIRMKEIVTN